MGIREIQEKTRLNIVIVLFPRNLLFAIKILLILLILKIAIIKGYPLCGFENKYGQVKSLCGF